MTSWSIEIRVTNYEDTLRARVFVYNQINSTSNM